MLTSRLQPAICSNFRPLCTLLTALPPPLSAHLETHGYAVLDSAIPPAHSASLRREIDALADAAHLQPNATHIVSASATSTFTKRNVLEAELAHLPPATLAALPALAALTDDPTVYASLSVHAPRFTLTEHALKVQRAEGDGACFPIHVDSSPSVDRRVVTALLYLNDAWDSRADGGCLRLYNTPTHVVDIEPVDARLVLLASTGMHHRVLPSFKRRYVITMWCSGSVRQLVPRNVDDADIEARVAFKLMQPRFKDIAFRLLLVDEWEQSLWEAHPKDVASKAVEMHRENLSLIREKLPAALCKELAEERHIVAVERLVRDSDALRDVFRRVAERDATGFSFNW